MVAAAKKDAKREREALDKRNEQLQSQLRESETLLASHQEQLAELKQAMSDLSAPRSDLEGITTNSTAPSTPALESQEQMNRLFDALNISPTTPGGEDVAPAPPTHFSHLVSPVLRTDVQAFEDFHALMDIARRSGPSSRVTSGNYSNFSGLGLSNLGKSEQTQLTGRLPSNASTSSLSASNTYNSPSSTPNLPPSTNTSISSRDLPVGGTLLKETAFYKRALVEDIEPTMRLDAAPGLSWLARRSVISSICEGRLIVEPMPSSSRPHHHPCSLCGEQSRNEDRARKHRFRINDSETAQRYPLCEYCLNRVRSTCDFLGFLRMVKDGHWRTEGSQAEASAWEESVRLRERMFWARIGGGVVPAFLRARPETPRSSTEETNPVPSGVEDSAPEELNSKEHDLPNQAVVNEPPTPSSNPPSPLASSQTLHTGLKIHSQDETRNQPITLKAPTPERETFEDANPTAQTETNPVENEKRSSSSLQRTITRSSETSQTEGSGKVINSIAKRAAMFERQTSQDAASNQLQQSLHASTKNKTSNGRRDVNMEIPGAFK